MMLTVIRIRIYAIVVVISAVDVIAATAARDRKVHRVNQDRRVYREHPVRRGRLDLRAYRAKPGRRDPLGLRDYRVNRDLRVYRVKPGRRGPPDLRVYKESPDRRAHLSQVIFYFMLMVTGDRSPSDLVKI